MVIYANQSLQSHDGIKWSESSLMQLQREASVILTSLRAFSNFGLLSSTLSLDCCFNFRSIAVTKETR